MYTTTLLRLARQIRSEVPEWCTIKYDNRQILVCFGSGWSQDQELVELSDRLTQKYGNRVSCCADSSGYSVRTYYGE